MGSRARPVILSLRRRSVCNFLLIRKSHITSVSYRLQWKAVMYSRTDSRKFKTISRQGSSVPAKQWQGRSVSLDLG